MNDRQIAALKPTSVKQEISIPNERALYLLVYPSGTKSFQFRPRIDGKLVRKTLGKYPAMSLRQAKAATMKLRAEVETARQQGVKKPVAVIKPKRNAAVTLTEAWGLYMAAEGNGKVSGQNKWGSFKLDIEPALGGTAITSVTRDDLEDLLAKKAEKFPVASNKLFATLSRFFNWCTAEGYRQTRLQVSPMANVARQGTNGNACDRFLSEQEIKWFFKSVSKAGVFENGFRAILYTGQRREAIFGAMRSQLNGDVLTIEVKKGVSTPITADVWLCKPVMKTIPAEGDPIFQGRGDAANKALDRVLERMQNLAAHDGLEVERFTPHDIRRTMANWMGDQVDEEDNIVIDEFIIERCMSHVSSTVRQKHYSQNRYLKAKKRAWKLWADYLEALESVP